MYVRMHQTIRTIYIYTGLCDVDISFFSDVNLLVERASLASDSK
jgi:hypothetical protein